MEKIQYEGLKGKYNNFVAPEYRLIVDGVNIQEKNQSIVTNLIIDLSCEYKSGICSFELHNIYDHKNKCIDQSILGKTINLGNEIKVVLGYSGKMTLVFHGFINTIDTTFTPDEGPVLHITAYDGLKFMMIAKRTKSFPDKKKYSEVVQEIVSSYKKIFLGKNLDTTSEADFQFDQSDESDFEFIKRISAQIGYFAYVEKGKFVYKDTSKAKGKVLLAKMGEAIFTYSRSIDIGNQPSKVIVRGKNDDDPEEEIVGESEMPDSIGNGSKSAKDVSEIIKSYINENEIEIFDSKIKTKESAKLKAQAVFNSLSLEFINISVTLLGLPEILPGNFVEISGISSQDDKQYLITDVTHSIGDGGFETTIKAKANKI